MASADMKARPFGRVDGAMAARASARHGVRASASGVFTNTDHGTKMDDNRRADVADVARADAAMIRTIAETGHYIDRGRVEPVSPRVLALIAPRKRGHR